MPAKAGRPCRLIAARSGRRRTTAGLLAGVAEGVEVSVRGSVISGPPHPATELSLRELLLDGGLIHAGRFPRDQPVSELEDVQPPEADRSAPPRQPGEHA